MNKRVLPATIIAATAVALALPTAAYAGSKGRSSCSESFAKWHVSIEQPEGGYVTIDFGRDGVDYTTTVWQVTEMTPLGALFPGTTIRVLWHAADGTVLREKGNGVPISVEDCSTTPTTTPTTAAPTTQPPASPTTVAEVTTTMPVPTTVAPVTTIIETTTTTAPIDTTVPTACPGGFTNEPGAAAPAVADSALPASCPGRLTNEHTANSTIPSPSTTAVAPTFLLPATGPDQAGPTAVVGTLTLGLGMLLTAVTRRKAVRV